jgi:hypothetical protein
VKTRATREARVFDAASRNQDTATMIGLALNAMSPIIRRWAAMWMKRERNVTIAAEPPQPKVMNGH